MKIRAGDLEEGDRFLTMHTNRTGTVMGRKFMTSHRTEAILIHWDGEEYYYAPERKTKKKPDCRAWDNLHPDVLVNCIHGVWVNGVYEPDARERARPATAQRDLAFILGVPEQAVVNMILAGKRGRRKDRECSSHSTTR